jgi:hypothetical protein
MTRKTCQLKQHKRQPWPQIGTIASRTWQLNNEKGMNGPTSSLLTLQFDNYIISIACVRMQ